VQLPHPPLFLACTNPETVRRAAQYGVGPMVLGFGGPEVIGGMRRMFDEERAARDPDAVVSPGMINDEFVALCPTFLMDDRDEAFRKGCRALRFFAEAISHWSAPNGVAPARDTEGIDNAAYMAEHLRQARAAIERGEAPPTAASPLYNTDHALGDVDTAIAYVERLRAAGVDNVMCLIQMGTLTQDEMMESIRLFGEQVIPHFRTEDRAAQPSAAS
jgi:alkanesulfonate monooxygenase SsuD/methylene tetrahydromethanopterin reductase-like flavin-dependent oxidoreductase (luciferase family)